MHELINSEQNSRVKYLKKLHDSRKRRKKGKFILEGYRIIKEAISAEAIIDQIFMTPSFYNQKEGKEIYSLLEQSKKEDSLILIEERLLYKIADTDNPQGILAITQENLAGLDDIFLNSKRILLIDRIQDPGNLGTIIRTAVAAGIDGIIILKGSVDIYNLKVLRATMGAIFNISICKDISLEDFLSQYQVLSEGFKLISTSLNTDRYYNQIDYTGKIIISIGNEANGLDEKIIKISDYIVKIPIIGEIDSLNAGIAAGIIIYKAVEANGIK
ncbi:MAG: TrmH family RNA methyltransferase [Halanaerobiaceae bacterium]